MNRQKIIAVIAGMLVLIGLAAAPVIQAALPTQQSASPIYLAPPRAAGYSGPLHTWSAYQPIDGISSAPASAGE